MGLCRRGRLKEAMKQRAIVALTLGPLALLLIYLGGWFYFVPVVVILALATQEYTQLAKNIGWRVHFFLLLAAVSGQWVLGQWPQPALSGPVLLLSLLLILAYILWTYEKETSQTVPADWMGTVGGFVLLGVLGSHFFLLRGLPELAWQWTMLAMLCTWFGDGGAYVVGKFVAGRYIGKHKMSPRLSPNKTVEGYVGGILFGVVFSLVFAYFTGIPLAAALIMALLITLLTPLGDLGISLLKREARVKDSGNVFRSHGGALDRIDTLLWAVPLAYYVALYSRYLTF